VVIALAAALALQHEFTEDQLTLLREMRATFEECELAALRLRRRGRIDEMQPLAGKAEAACRKAIAALPNLPEPHVLLGRMRSAMQRDDEALAAFDAALALEPEYAPAVYHRLLIHVRRGDDRRQLGVIGRCVSFLEERLDALTPAQRMYVKARAMMLRGWTDEALIALREAQRQGLLEAYEASAELSVALGRPDDAMAALTEALRKDAGVAYFYHLRGMLRVGKPQGTEAATADFDRAIEIDPSRALTWSSRALVRARIAGATRDRALGRAAVGDGDEAVKRAPQSARAWADRAAARFICARFGDEDADALFRGAVEDYSAAIERDPADATMWMARGSTRLEWARHRRRSGEDTRALYEQAQEDATRAVRLDSRDALAWIKLGTARHGLADQANAAGADPRPLLWGTISAYSAAIASAPGTADGWLARGRARTYLAAVMQARGESAARDYQAALADLAEAARLDPRLAADAREPAEKCRRETRDLSPDDERAAVAKALDELRTTGDAAMDAALALRRAGKMDEMEKQVRRVEDLCHRTAQAHPQLAQPHYRLGRALRLAMREPEALAQQQEALGRDPNHPGARYERLLLTLRRDAPQTQSESDSCRGDFAALLGGSDALGRAQIAWLRGEEAASSGRLDEARGLFREAIETSPDLDEAYVSLASLEQRAGRLDEAIAGYTRSLERDRGLSTHWLGRGLMRLDAGRRAKDKRADIYRAAIADFDEAARLVPGLARAWRARGHAKAHLALLPGEDADALFRSALADLDEAVRRDPDGARNWSRRGTVRAEQARKRGDAADLYKAAGEDADRAIALDPRDSDPWTLRGDVRRALGRYAEAVDDLTEAIFRDVRSGELWMKRGQARSDGARAQAAAGQDPSTALAEAIGDFEASIRHDPSPDEPWLWRASARFHLADVRAQRGRDPGALADQGIADCGEALKRDPARRDGWSRRGTARWVWAARAQDPAAQLDAAIEDLTQAIKLDATDAGDWAVRAAARLRRARAKDDYRAALADAREAIRLDPAMETRLRDLLKECGRVLGD